jgi:hypothetical protein
MKKLLLFWILLVRVSVGHAEGDSLDELKKGLPKDVAAMVERIATCTHFGGEEPYDTARSREIESAMKRYGCDRLARDESVLQKRYKQNVQVQNALRKAHEW